MLPASGIVLLSALLLARAASSTPTVTVKNGTYAGLSAPSFDQEHFLGMPYAQPPVSALRFRAPLSLNSSWTGTRSATKYSPICIGYPSGGADDDAGYDLSEDCLTLNIIRPKGVKKRSNVPVVLWIYGGGFSMGGSADRRYNGSWIVDRSVELKKPIIFVSLNYRVNVFGFIQSKEVAAEGAGNFGLLDQKLSLEWLHENIAAFGGDPSKVTIMGESAGAISIGLQLLNGYESSTKLFRAAILESGSATTAAYRTVSEYQPSYDAVVSSTGCAASGNTLDCLRKVPLDKFVAATNSSRYSWFPVVDGTFLKDLPSKLLNAGKVSRVPLLLGANTDEGVSFGRKRLNTPEQLANALRQNYAHMSNATIDRLLELYPDDPYYGCPFNTGDAYVSSGRQDKRSNAISGDAAMQAGRRWLSDAMAKYNKDVFVYRFDQPNENATVEVGTPHFMEVAYVFSNPLPTQNPLPKRAGDMELASFMTSSWVSFVHDLSPDFKGREGPKWPNYKKDKKGIVLRRHSNFVEDDDWRKEGIAFINSVAEEMQV